MNAAANDGPNSTDPFHDERERLHAELATVRQQRNGLLAELAACRLQVRERDATIEQLTATIEQLTARLEGRG